MELNKQPKYIHSTHTRSYKLQHSNWNATNPFLPHLHSNLHWRHVSEWNLSCCQLPKHDRIAPHVGRTLVYVWRITLQSWKDQQSINIKKTTMIQSQQLNFITETITIQSKALTYFWKNWPIKTNHLHCNDNQKLIYRVICCIVSIGDFS